MGTYNYLATDAVCSNCGAKSYFTEIQFKYGLCRQEKYLLGLKIEKDLNRRLIDINESPDDPDMTIDGIGKCPLCHQPSKFKLKIVDSAIIQVESIKLQSG